MPRIDEPINVSLSSEPSVYLALYLAQKGFRARVLSLEQVLAAAEEAESAIDGLGLTAEERVGIRIEVSSSDGTPARHGVVTATFAELERTRAGWRLNRLGREINRVTKSNWLATSLPPEHVLARAATRALRRGTNGVGRL